MKEKILALLIAKFLGVNEGVLSRIAEKLAKTATTDEEATTSAEGVTFQNVLDNHGDSRATEATQTAIASYEKKHGLKEGSKATGGGPDNTKPNQEEDGEPGWFKTYRERQDGRIAKIETEKQSEQFSAILKGKCKDMDEAFFNVATQGREFKSEEEVTVFAEDLQTKWGAYSQTLADEGLSRMSKPPSGGASPKEGAAAIADLISKGTEQINNSKK